MELWHMGQQLQMCTHCIRLNLMLLYGCVCVPVCLCVSSASLRSTSVCKINLAARGLNEFLRQLLSPSLSPLSLSHMLCIYPSLLAINPVAHLMPSQAVSQLSVGLSGILYFRQIQIKQQLKSLSLSPLAPTRSHLQQHKN